MVARNLAQSPAVKASISSRATVVASVLVICSLPALAGTDGDDIVVEAYASPGIGGGGRSPGEPGLARTASCPPASRDHILSHRRAGRRDRTSRGHAPRKR